jgi:hypothetical protein
MSGQSSSTSITSEERLMLTQAQADYSADAGTEQGSSPGRHLSAVSTSGCDLQEESAQCFLRMEDDDDSSHDFLSAIDAELAFGNIYCGHKQVLDMVNSRCAADIKVDI